MNKHRFFSLISFVRKSYKATWLKTWSSYKNPLKNEIWKGLNRYFPKDAHQKSGGGSVRSDLRNLDSFTLETSKYHLIRNFLRNGRLRVNVILEQYSASRHAACVSRPTESIWPPPDSFSTNYFWITSWISLKNMLKCRRNKTVMHNKVLRTPCFATNRKFDNFVIQFCVGKWLS